MKAVNPTHAITYGGAQVNVYHANKGEGIPKHDHAYSHATICHAGRIAVRKEGKYVGLTKESTPVSLAPAEWHEIEALEDGTVFTNIFQEGKI